MRNHIQERASQEGGVGHVEAGSRPSMTKVLLVEDEPGLVMTLTDRLMAEGYDVESATDAPSGLEMATSGSFDAILLDVMLPGG